MTPEQILDMRKVLMESCSWSAKDVQDLPLDDLVDLYQLVMLDKGSGAAGGRSVTPEEIENDQGLAADWPICKCGHTKRRHVKITARQVAESCCNAAGCFCVIYHPVEPWEEADVQVEKEP